MQAKANCQSARHGRVWLKTRFGKGLSKGGKEKNDSNRNWNTARSRKWVGRQVYGEGGVKSNSDGREQNWACGNSLKKGWVGEMNNIFAGWVAQGHEGKH